MPKRLANEDNDGVVFVVVDAGVVQVAVLFVLVVFVVDDALETAAAAAAAASKNIFIDGSPDSILLLKPKLAKFEKFGLDFPVAFNALAYVLAKSEEAACCCCLLEVPAAAANERLFKRFDAFMLEKFELLVLVEAEELGVCEARLSLVRVRIEDELLGDMD